MNNINFNEIPCHLKGLIFNENRKTALKQAYKNRHNNCINQLNIINNLYGEGCKNPDNNFTLKLYLIRQSNNQ